MLLARHTVADVGLVRFGARNQASAATGGGGNELHVYQYKGGVSQGGTLPLVCGSLALAHASRHLIEPGTRSGNYLWCDLQ